MLQARLIVVDELRHRLREFYRTDRENTRVVPSRAGMALVEVNIAAGREQVAEPWVWKLCREFNVKVFIRKANVDSDFGVMSLELEGAGEDIQRATAWLMTTGMRVEAMQRALGA
jgi:ABC-type methionine transport system ATPase subunit